MTSQAIDDALPELCERLRGRLRFLLTKYHIPPEDAEDLLQTALLITVSKWSEIYAADGWLLATLERRCILYWRTRRAHEQRYVQLDDWAPELAIDPPQERRVLLADLKKVGRRLSIGNRKLLELRFRQGLSPGEAASAMGLAANSIRKMTNRALAQLRLLVGTEPPPAAQGTHRPRPRGPSLAKQLRAGGGAGTAWMAAVDAFAAASGRQAPSREALARELAGAGARLGLPRLCELTAEALAAYRGGAEDGAVPVIHEVYLLRSFLRWSGGRGELHLEAPVFDKALGFSAPRRQRRMPSGVEPVDPAWLATIDRYLAARCFASSSHHQIRHHLLEMTRASTLAGKPLGAVTASDLLVFRAELLKDGRAAATHVGALSVVRGFLLWARAQGAVGVDTEVIRGILRGWRASAGYHRGAPPIAGAAGAAWTAAVEAFLVAVRLDAPTQRRDRQHLTAVRASVGRTPLEALTEDDLTAFRAELSQTGRPGSLQVSLLGAVQRFLVWAHEQGLTTVEPARIRSALNALRD